MRSEHPTGDAARRRRLLVRLGRELHGFALWKHRDRTVEGHGDVDAVLPTSARAGAVAVVAGWAEEAGAGPVVVCRHVPARTTLAVVLREPEARLEQIDLVHSFVVHAAPLVGAAAVAPLSELVDGFRALRPGAEGLLRLLVEELRAGRPRAGGDLAPVRALLVSDPSGLRECAAALGRPGTHAARLAAAVADGRWDRGAALRLEAAVAARALAGPRLVARCLAFDLRRRRCTLLDALAAGRRPPPDVSAWLGLVAQTHDVVDPVGRR